MEAQRLEYRSSGRLTPTYTVCSENPIDNVKSCTANNYSITITDEETLSEERRISTMN